MTTTQDLLLAAEVRKLAVARQTARMPEGLTPEQKEQYRAAPINPLIKEVLAELEAIAYVVNKHRQPAG